MCVCVRGCVFARRCEHRSVDVWAHACAHVCVRACVPACLCGTAFLDAHDCQQNKRDKAHHSSLRIRPSWFWSWASMSRVLALGVGSRGLPFGTCSSLGWNCRCVVLKDFVKSAKARLQFRAKQWVGGGMQGMRADQKHRECLAGMEAWRKGRME